MIILNTKKHKIEIGGTLPTEEMEAKSWRDMELSNTDWIVPTTDHPQHADYLVYRQELRDWPSTESFPDTKPSL